MSFSAKDKRYRRYFSSCAYGKRRKITGVVLALCMILIFASALYTDDEAVDIEPPADERQQASIETSVLVRQENNNNTSYVKTHTQKFSKEDYFPDHIPAQGVITDGYGYRTDPSPGFHYALDIAGSYASAIYAAADGRVAEASSDDVYGNYVIIDHLYDGYKSKYAHMCAYLVSIGQNVKKGEIIGFMGSTGYSTGTHLHYEIIKYNERLDPLGFITVYDGQLRLE